MMSNHDSKCIDGRFPPRLSMSEYLNYVESSLHDTDPRQVMRQKQIEEQIDHRFSLHRDLSPDNSRLDGIRALVSAISGAMVNEDIVRRLLNNIEGYVTELRQSDDITHEKFLTDIRAQRFVERTLQITVEACVDVAHHIISDEKWREPGTCAEAFAILAENGVVPSNRFEQYQLMAQFRNKIVHYYEKVDPEQVFAVFKGHLSDFIDFVESIRAWLDKRSVK